MFHGDIRKQAGGICFVLVTTDKGEVNNLKSIILIGPIRMIRQFIVSLPSYTEDYGEEQNDVLLQELRGAVGEMAGSLPRMQRMEHL